MPAVGIAVVGASGWGQNVVRAFFVARGSALRWVCDLNEALLAGIETRFPGVKVTRTFDQVLADPGVHAVAVAVDAPNHHRLAKAALESGRHVFVEKPLALTAGDADELCQLAERRGLVLMVGHLLLYHPAVERVKATLDAGELGDVLYLYAQRVNLGIVREAENAWWSLAPHDVALAIHLFGASPVSVSATGATYLQRDRHIEDVAFAALRFADGRMAHLHVSWLDPHKRRSLTVVGTRRMLAFDDTLPDEKLKIYDRGAMPRPGHTTYAQGVVVRGGDVVSPALPNAEPLVAECEHFVARVTGGGAVRSDGRQGLAVVRVLEAGMTSMRAGGIPVPIS
ncbi:MAG: Gfo/Idh/MocA family oxidoreductase [Pseudomonadota bacterium]